MDMRLLMIMIIFNLNYLLIFIINFFFFFFFFFWGGSLSLESGVYSKQIGSLRNDDGDVNENVKKAIGLYRLNNNSARASRFLVHFFTVTVGLRHEIS